MDLQDLLHQIIQARIASRNQYQQAGQVHAPMMSYGGGGLQQAQLPNQGLGMSQGSTGQMGMLDFGKMLGSIFGFNQYVPPSQTPNTVVDWR